MKIAVAGTGYVGLSIATLLSQHHEVMAVDIIPEKVDLINRRKSPIQDEYIEKYLTEKQLNLTATLDAEAAYTDADFVVIAAPTNYDSKKNFFDTSAVEAVIKLVIQYNPDAIMVIKSTIPVGFTASVREKYHCDNIIFSPEFLRESKALYDNLYPSRIIVGTDVENARLVKAANTFAGLLQEGGDDAADGRKKETEKKNAPAKDKGNLYAAADNGSRRYFDIQRTGREREENGRVPGSVLDRGAGKGKCKSNRGEAGGKGNGGTGDRSGNGRRRLGGGAL